MQFADNNITVVKDKMETRKITMAIKVVTFSEREQSAEVKWVMVISGEPNEEQLPIVYHDIIIDLDNRIQQFNINKSITEAFNNYMRPAKDCPLEDIRVFDSMKEGTIHALEQML